VNVWLWGAAILGAALIPLGLAAAGRRPPGAVVALAAAGTDAALALLLLAEGTHSQSFATLALVAGVTGFIGSIAFLHFLERLG
jgi:multisubunit Na+/H+ antiporter MnhF subunit